MLFVSRGILKGYRTETLGSRQNDNVSVVQTVDRLAIAVQVVKNAILAVNSVFPMRIDNALDGGVSSMFKGVRNRIQLRVGISIESLSNRSIASTAATNPSDFNRIILSGMNARTRRQTRKSSRRC